jgi:hypothetical protein
MGAIAPTTSNKDRKKSTSTEDKSVKKLTPADAPNITLQVYSGDQVKEVPIEV